MAFIQHTGIWTFNRLFYPQTTQVQISLRKYTCLATRNMVLLAECIYVDFVNLKQSALSIYPGQIFVDFT